MEVEKFSTIVRELLDRVDTFVKNGEEPPIFKSANVEHGDEYNQKQLEKFKGRVRCLY